MRDFATCTTKELHLFADGTSGNDANNGRTALTPKKTLQHAVNLAPKGIGHNIMVHCSGSFADQGDLLISGFHSYDNAQLYIMGSADYTDVGGGAKTTTGSSTSSLVVGGAGWTPNQYRGYFARVLTGPAAGDIRAIANHTADTITPIQNFSVDPGVGATFDIVRPTTAWQASTVLSRIRMENCVGNVVFGQFYIAGSQATINIGAVGSGYLGELTLCNVIEDVTYARSLALARDQAAMLRTSPGRYNDSFVFVNGGGVCIRGTKKSVLYSSQLALISFVHEPTLELYHCGLWGLLDYGGQAGGGVILEDCATYTDSCQIGQFRAGYATPKITGAGVGLKLVNSRCRIGACDISNCGSHGVEVDRSNVHFAAATAGSGNTGAGAYAHSCSVVYTKAGSPPTLTGGAGNLSTNGTTEATTWADLEAGGDIFDLNEGVRAKKVA